MLPCESACAEPLAPGRKRGAEADRVRQVRRHGDDHRPGGHGGGLGVDLDALV